MKGHHHDHNLRSAPHSDRKVRANSRSGHSNRSGTNLPHQSAPARGTRQQLQGPETLGSMTQTNSGHAENVSATTSSMQIIAAQQQQMMQMQRMMQSMQQQMAALQQTITTMGKSSPEGPLITAPKGGQPSLTGITAAEKEATHTPDNQQRSDGRAAGTTASGSLDPSVKESTVKQMSPSVAAAGGSGTATNKTGGAVSTTTSRGDGATHKHKASRSDGAPQHTKRKGMQKRGQRRDGKRRPATGPTCPRRDSMSSRSS